MTSSRSSAISGSGRLNRTTIYSLFFRMQSTEDESTNYNRTETIVKQFLYCLFRGQKMAPILYYLPPSPPCRAVLMLGKMLGIDFELKTVNIQEGEHLKADFVEVRWTQLRFIPPLIPPHESFMFRPLTVESPALHSHTRRQRACAVGEPRYPHVPRIHVRERRRQTLSKGRQNSCSGRSTAAL